jgi:hypothetical protein
MLLSVGCFAGACLPYAIRTHSFPIADLIPFPDRQGNFVVPANAGTTCPCCPNEVGTE